MSILSAVKKLVAKVNEHTNDLREADIDINELYDRVIALEGGDEGEGKEEGKSASSSDEEEGFKLED